MRVLISGEPERVAIAGAPEIMRTAYELTELRT